MVSRAGRLIAAGLLAVISLVANASAETAKVQNSTISGEFWAEPPTLMSR